MTGAFALKFKRYCGFDWPGWLRVSIWTIAALLLVGFALRDFHLLISDLQYNNAATQVNVIIKNDSIKRPELAVCLPYYSDALFNVADWVIMNLGEILKNNSPFTENGFKCQTLKNNS